MMNFDQILEQAIEEQNFSKLEELIPKGKRNLKKTFLYACKTNNLVVVRWCIARDDTCIRTEDYKGLSIASEHNHIEIVRYILPMLPRPNVDGNEALVKACQTGNLELVKLFVENCLKYVEEQQRVYPKKFICEDHKFKDPDMLNDVNFTRNCLWIGLLTDSRQRYDHFAVSSLEILQYFVETFAFNVNYEMNWEGTLLGSAIQRGLIENVKYLLKQGSVIRRIDVVTSLSSPNSDQILLLLDQNNPERVYTYLFDHLLQRANIDNQTKTSIQAIFDRYPERKIVVLE